MYGKPGTNFPNAKSGVVIAPGTRTFYSYNLRPYTVYYLEPGIHFGFFEADTSDAFVGGDYDGKLTYLSGHNNPAYRSAIDSNSSDGDQQNVTIEYLTMQRYRPWANGGAVNQESNTGWHIKYNVITLNVPGAGVILGDKNVLAYNCITLNGQYGFQSELSNSWGKDALTGGPHDITVQYNEISYNDTCDFEGTGDNSVVGWHNYNPVPAKYRNSRCGTVVPDGDQGGFKLWQTNDVTIADNYIHNNWGPGAWADTNDANTEYTGNTFVGNDGPAIIEEISYNFSITKNYMVDNSWLGPANSGFPAPAIYVSESGSDTTFGGVPGRYRSGSVIKSNTLVNNGGGIFLWQNSNRYCSDGADGSCTLIGGAKGPFMINSCAVNLPTAAVNTTTYVGIKTGSPAEDWWDGCMWRTENVSVMQNVIDFNPAAIPNCNSRAWWACGVNGVYSEYGSPPNNEPGWVVPTDITFFQHNLWSDNIYNGPSTFFAWNQGNDENPVSWARWTGAQSKSDRCSGAGERQGGYCIGGFGQDSGSKYVAKS